MEDELVIDVEFVRSVARKVKVIEVRMMLSRMQWEDAIISEQQQVYQAYLLHAQPVFDDFVIDYSYNKGSKSISKQQRREWRRNSKSFKK